MLIALYLFAIYVLFWYNDGFPGRTYMTKEKEVETKKLKLNIKGKFQKYWVDLILKGKIKSLGLNLHKIEHKKTHSEVLISGETLKLWKVIDMSRRPLFFVELDQVVFQFTD